MILYSVYGLIKIYSDINYSSCRVNKYIKSYFIILNCFKLVSYY